MTAMQAGRCFHQLGDIVDELAQNGIEVRRVRTRDKSVLEEGLSVELEVAVGVLEQICSDAGASVRVPESQEATDSFVTTVEVEIPAEDVESDGSDSEASPSSGGGFDTGNDADMFDDTEDSTTATEDDGDVPYYRDRELLASVYEECDTFAEMTEVLDVDVTQATVRQHMVKQGIHPPSPTEAEKLGIDPDPTKESKIGEDPDEELDADGAVDPEHARELATADDELADTRTGEDAPTAEVESAVTDGIGLPDDITLEELKRVVQESRTFYEVHTTLGIEREMTRELLAELNLLDLVTSRLATIHEREVSMDEIDQRIRGAV